MLDPERIIPDIVPTRIRKLSRREYDKLVDLGAFEDEKLELLRGVLVTMSPQKRPHASMVEALNRILISALDASWRVRPGLPFAATDDSEPEPDFLISRGPVGDHPTAAELVIEVSDSSLRKDKRIKTSIYAENGVPEYWIFNLRQQVVEVMTDPRDGGYTTTTIVDKAGTLHPAGVPLVIEVGALPWIAIGDDDEAIA